MTDIPRPEIEMGRFRVRFFVKRRVEQTPTQAPKKALAPMRVSIPVTTAFDLVRYAPGIGGIGRAIEPVAPLLSPVQIPKLKQVLETENESDNRTATGLYC